MGNRTFSMGEVDQLLDEHSDDNHSELAREFFKAYYSGSVGDATSVGIEKRRERLEQEIDQFHEMIEARHDELERLDTYEEGEDQARDADLDEALATLSTIPIDKREPSNPAIQTHASKIGMPADELTDRLNRAYPISADFERLKSLSNESSPTGEDETDGDNT